MTGWRATLAPCVPVCTRPISGTRSRKQKILVRLLSLLPVPISPARVTRHSSLASLSQDEQTHDLLLQSQKEPTHLPRQSISKDNRQSTRRTAIEGANRSSPSPLRTSSVMPTTTRRVPRTGYAIGITGYRLSARRVGHLLSGSYNTNLFIYISWPLEVRL